MLIPSWKNATVEPPDPAVVVEAQPVVCPASLIPWPLAYPPMEPRLVKTPSSQRHARAGKPVAAHEDPTTTPSSLIEEPSVRARLWKTPMSVEVPLSQTNVRVPPWLFS